MKKVVGYGIMAIGIIVIIMSYKSIQQMLGITLPTALSDRVMLIGGAVTVLIGAVVAFKSTIKKTELVEVPIYHEKDVVGYRRIRK